MAFTGGMRCLGRFLRYRVCSSGMPRMAFAQALGSQNATFAGTMQADRFFRVFRAARIKAAILPYKWADAKLVSAQKQKQKGFHRGESGRREATSNCCSS